MKKISLLIILGSMFLIGCNAAMMNGFSRGVMGYPPPPYEPYQMQVAPIPGQQLPQNSMGTIYTPKGPVLYNTTNY